MMLFQHKLFHSCRELKEEKEKRGVGADFWGGETSVVYSSAADIKGSFKGQWVINFLSPATMICCDILSPHSSEALNINWEVR